MHHAQVAELVDALVSNTNEVTLVPVRLRPWVQEAPSEKKGLFLFKIAGGEVYPDEAKRISGTPALGTENPFRSNFEGFFSLKTSF